MRTRAARNTGMVVLALAAGLISSPLAGAANGAGHSVHAAAAVAAVGNVLTCPFCGTGSQTFTEEIAAMDVAVIAKIVKLPEKAKAGDDIEKATFEITQVLKGDGLVKVGERFETLYFGDGTIGKSYHVTGIDPPKVMWSTPLPVTDRAAKYLAQIMKLPATGPERMVFFQNYLEDEDEMLSRDAYDEFARAPYDEVRGLKAKMNHEQLVAWIKNPEIPASRRRLYLVMLGACGSEKDVPLLEEFLKSSDRRSKSGLDALIACYLTLKGEAGLPLVEQMFLANEKADYADTYAAIMALRFHGTDGGVIDKKRLVKSFHHMLARPELADLVIPDLAKFEDWEVMDKLFDLFKNANEKNSWVRVPVINYLRTCPLPKAKTLLQECEKIDPAAVKRANTFFPGAPSAAPAPAAEKTSRSQPAPAAAGSTLAMRGEPDGSPGQSQSVGGGPPVPPEDNGDELLAAANQGAERAAAIRHSSLPAANLWAVIGVPWAVGIAILLVQWSVLKSAAR